MKRKSNIVRFRRPVQPSITIAGHIRLTMLAGFAAMLAVSNLNVELPLVTAGEPPVLFSSGLPAKHSETLTARFGFCHSGGGTNCVVDGDTFWFGGEKIRIADIDTPETHPPRCAEEARLGEAATRRLHGLLNEGPFRLQSANRDTDRYGRALRIVVRNGESLGGVLVQEGLARWYGSGREPWC
jgi:micrococcal nuclease